MPYVEIQCPGGVERVDLDSETLLDGRHHGCDVRRSEPMLSRKHCCIERTDAGWSLRDLGSRNGTVVNGEAAAEWKLSNGDNIRVGDLVIRFIDPAEPPRRMSIGEALGSVERDPVERDRSPARPLDLIETPLEIDLASVVVDGRSDDQAFLWRLLERGSGRDVELESVEFHDGHGSVVPIDHLAGGVDGCDWNDLERIRVFRLMLLAAVRTDASAIEIEPVADDGLLRFTVDGLPTLIGRIGTSSSRGLVGTAELLCGVSSDSSELQVGEFSIGVQDEDRHVRLHCRFDGKPGRRRARISIIRTEEPILLERLGLAPRAFSRVRRIAVRDSGLLLVAGSPGSGRSTSLHALLREVDLGARRAVAVEERVEDRIEGVRHHRFGERSDETRKQLLERVTADDPDVLFIGEVTDVESAEVATMAARRKHLVHAGIQARDSITAVLRMLELGVDPHTLSSTLHLVIAQALVRRLCRGCSRSVPPSSSETLALGRSIEGLDQVRVAHGCAACVDTGYRGRIPVFELLEIDARLREAILHAPTTSSLRQAATSELFSPLRRNALNLVINGETSFEEVDRTVGTR
ncbi:MAG: Flp pilus assembly complex ATPase component [Phycisphaera sp.]|nr:Flp pilus assembly complex ATPase component [Phycisphaera sp.]